MTFTIKELCDFLGAEVPAELEAAEDQKVAGINARYTTLTPGDVFFDINNDCEDLSAISPTVCPFIISDREIEPGTLQIPVVRVQGALDQYVKLCKAFVDEHPETIRVAVTGSTGKTSCKETIAAVLGQIAGTDQSFSNQNNIYYLSKKYQKSMSSNLRFYVQEASLKAYEGISLTDQLAIAYQPRFSVMTNVHDNHAEEYGDRDAIFRIKRAIVERLPKDGYALLNYDDDILRNYHPDCNTVYYSLDNPEADIFASDIHISDQGTKFNIHWQGRTIENVLCPMIGRPNVYNCLVAFAIGSLCGNDDETLARAIKKVKFGYSLRQNHLQIGGYKLFVDCFNASLESIENDMDTMAELEPLANGRKVVVVGDVAELGEKAESIHREIGAVVAKYPIDRIFCYGHYASQMYEGARMSKPNVCVTGHEDREELEKAVADYIHTGDLILWKASRDTHLELSIDKLFGTDFYPLYPRETDEKPKVYSADSNWNPVETASERYYRIGEAVGGIEAKNPGVESEYCIYENGAKFARHYGPARYFKLPETLNGVAVRSIGDRAFYKNPLVSVDLPDSIVHIGTNAFLSCDELKKVKLPSGLKFIDYSAFAYCPDLSAVMIPASCMLVRRKAFQHCKRLGKVVVEGMNTVLEPEVFYKCPELELVCRAGSLAEKFAVQSGLPYRLMDENGDVGELTQVALPEKSIVIDSISLEPGEQTTRLNIRVIVGDDEPDTLWYEVDNQWKDALCDDRCDGIVVSLLLFAIRGKYAAIKSKCPISEELYYRLTYHLIPQIVDFEGEERACAVRLEMPRTSARYADERRNNGTGFSRGVDSFATLFEYGHNSEAPDDYKVNFLNVYNVGAFHGKDVGKRAFATTKELFKDQVKDTVAFAEKYGYQVLVVDSNLMLFLKDHFIGQEYGKLVKFQNSATERNIGTTLLFQKLFKRFYYASGHKMKEFNLSLDESSALWEQYGVQFFQTENTRFFISNRDWSRMEKIQRVVTLPEAYDNLQVCLLSSHNCGKCMKCRRTLMNLDVLGEDVLDRFAGSFDLKEYKEHDRQVFFDEIWTEKDKDGYAMDIFKEAVKRHSPLIADPPIRGTDKSYVHRLLKDRISVMEYPTVRSKELMLLTDAPDDPDFKILGRCPNNWLKAEFADGRIGYVPETEVAIAETKLADAMVLNAGDSLMIAAGKRYGLLPKFTPKGSREQMSYKSSCEEAAIVTKSGWIYALNPGNTVITAVSKSGLSAQCSVEVVTRAEVVARAEAVARARAAARNAAPKRSLLRRALGKVKKMVFKR